MESNPKSIASVEIGKVDSVRGFLFANSVQAHTVGRDASDLVKQGTLLAKHDSWDRPVSLEVRSSEFESPGEVLVSLCWEYDNRPYSVFLAKIADVSMLSDELVNSKDWHSEVFKVQDNRVLETV